MFTSVGLPITCIHQYIPVQPTAQNTAYIPSTGLFEVGLHILLLSLASSGSS